MDRYSHIALAKKLMEITQQDIHMGYLSIVAKIDGKPDHLHRLHCHPLVKAPKLMEASMKVFGSKDKNATIKDDSFFEYKRLLEDKDNFIEDYIYSGGNDVADMAVTPGYGAILSIVSHTYFDTFNNTVQALAPFDFHCAGQYEMWKKVDYFNYRIKWYAETAPSVRENVCKEDFWNTSFKPEELIKGIVRRIAYHTKPAPSLEAIKNVETVLGVDNVEYIPKTEDFLVKLEESLEKNIIESVKE